MSDPSDRLHRFAQSYTAAWCSQDPGTVAAHYSPNGSLSINGGAPAVGRPAIKAVATLFMTALPDMQLTMDRLMEKADCTEYHWTLIGMNSGPGGKGNRVHISGLEIWKLGRDGLIEKSRGEFDNHLYQQQLASGLADSD